MFVFKISLLINITLLEIVGVIIILMLVAKFGIRHRPVET